MSFHSGRSSWRTSVVARGLGGWACRFSVRRLRNSVITCYRKWDLQNIRHLPLRYVSVLLRKRIPCLIPTESLLYGLWWLSQGLFRNMQVGVPIQGTPGPSGLWWFPWEIPECVPYVLRPTRLPCRCSIANVRRAWNWFGVPVRGRSNCCLWLRVRNIPVYLHLQWLLASYIATSLIASALWTQSDKVCKIVCYVPVAAPKTHCHIPVRGVWPDSWWGRFHNRHVLFRAVLLRRYVYRCSNTFWLCKSPHCARH